MGEDIEYMWPVLAGQKLEILVKLKMIDGYEIARLIRLGKLVNNEILRKREQKLREQQIEDELIKRQRQRQSRRQYKAYIYRPTGSSTNTYSGTGNWTV